MYIRLRLTAEQRQRAIAEAERRQASNERSRLQGRNAGPALGRQALLAHYVGAGGEMAVAALLGLEADVFSERSARRGSSDLPGRIDVKTRAKHHYDLIVQRDEEDDKRLVLVTLEDREFRVHGWIQAGAGKRQEFWGDPAGGRPAFFVPKSALLAMDTLPLALVRA